MARDFQSGDPDNIRTFTIPDTLSEGTTSVFFWLYPDDTDQYAMVFCKGTGDAERMEFDNSWGWVIGSAWSGNEGKWSMPKPSAGAWVHGGYTMDWSSASNNPVMYQNGVSQSVTGRATPTGSRNGSTALTLGQYFDDGYGTLTALDGKLAEFAIWDRILTTAEISALSKGFSPLFFKRGLAVYIPLIGKASPEVNLKGGTATVNGATAFPHPRIIYPTHFYFPAASAGGTLYTKELSDTIGLSDNIARLVGKVQTDTVTLTSTVASVATLYRTLTDSLALSSAVTSLRSTFVSLSDSISFSSTVAAAKTAAVSLSDSIGLTEAFSLIKSFGRSFSDSIGLSSAIETLVVGTKGLSDSISLTDTLSIILNSLSAGIPGKFKDAIRSIQKTGSRAVGVFKNNDPEGISFQKERPDADEVR